MSTLPVSHVFKRFRYLFISFLDILFYLFQTFSFVGVVSYVLFALSVTMTFSCCIKSPKAMSWNKLFIVIFDLVACKYTIKHFFHHC